jgi:hypothetical protein
LCSFAQAAVIPIQELTLIIVKSSTFTPIIFVLSLLNHTIGGMKEMYLFNISSMNNISQHIPNEMDKFFSDLKNNGSEYSSQVLSMAGFLAQPRENATSVINNTKVRSNFLLKKAA